MSALADSFLADLRQTHAYDPGDRLFMVESRDPRRPWRTVVSAAVVDGNAAKTPAVLVAARTSDGHHQETGITSREQARAVLDAIWCAWPDLFPVRS